MTPFIEMVINMIVRFWCILTPVYFVPAMKAGIVMTMGWYTRSVQRGLHFKLPILEEYQTHHVCTDTINLETQRLVTKDGFNVEIGAIVKFKVNNIRDFMIEVVDAQEALEDITYSAIRAYTVISKWDELSTTDPEDRITNIVRKSAKKWGIFVEAVTLTDVALDEYEIIARAMKGIIIRMDTKHKK